MPKKSKPKELTIHKIARYGWVPDLPDQRDHTYAAPVVALKALPARVDLRKACPPVYDQGALGSCTGNAIAAAVQFSRRKQAKRPDFVPSRLFIYYNERKIEGTVNQDSGAQIRDGVKSVANQGVCPETSWPYDARPYPPNPLLTVEPNPQCYKEALKYKVIAYQRITRALTQMKGCIASGKPFVFGFTVYESFESPGVAKTGVVPMPTSTDAVIGGHAVLAVGYDDPSHRFIVRNSWGTKWGMKGYFTMPYAYLLEPNLSDDFWTISGVDG
jgi:C1A family cysteine protease